MQRDLKLSRSKNDRSFLQNAKPSKVQDSWVAKSKPPLGYEEWSCACIFMSNPQNSQNYFYFLADKNRLKQRSQWRIFTANETRLTERRHKNRNTLQLKEKCHSPRGIVDDFVLSQRVGISYKQEHILKRSFKSGTCDNQNLLETLSKYFLTNFLSTKAVN